MKKPGKFWYGVACITTLVWSLPFCLAAIICFLSIVAIPIGVVLMGIACAPFYAVQQRRIKKITKWQLRDRPLYEGKLKPWLVE